VQVRIASPLQQIILSDIEIYCNSVIGVSACEPADMQEPPFPADAAESVFPGGMKQPDALEKPKISGDAGGRTRTGTPSLAVDFEGVTSFGS
jgi:hypothetical protein